MHQKKNLYKKNFSSFIFFAGKAKKYWLKAIFAVSIEYNEKTTYRGKFFFNIF